MPVAEIHVNLFDLVSSLAKTADMISPEVADHHMRVAYIAFRIAQHLDWPPEQRRELVMAGALHDIGAFSLQERLNLLEFEYVNPGQHARAGYLLLSTFKPFQGIANIIHYHHLPWGNGKGASKNGRLVPLGSHILNLADRVAILLTRDEPPLTQVEHIMRAIEHQRGRVFKPELVDALLSFTHRDFFWLETMSSTIESVLRRAAGFQAQDLMMGDLVEFSRLMCQVIDFKSAFTATHSSGVAETSVALARLMGYSGTELEMIRVSANLHDLGKLAIPSEILEKPGKLSEAECDIMRTHVYYTHQILDPIDALSLIKSWGALHQERLNGTGYPFSYKREELPLVSRLIAVADVFTAITENRPYREGLGKQKVTDILRKMMQDGELEPIVVDLLIENFSVINEARIGAQERAEAEYQEFQRLLHGDVHSLCEAQ